MKLYYTPGVCSLVPHIALRQAGLDITLEQFAPKSKRTHSGINFLEINPNGYVPALGIEPGLVLTEGRSGHHAIHC